MKKIDDSSMHLEILKEQALDMMSKSGFPISSHVEVVLDKELPFMGYTTDKSGHPVIVVSGNSLKSGLALHLFIHELSHIYRSDTHHPSHNYQLLTAITAWVMHGRAVESYQENILHAILNNIQDVYADDISFKVFDAHFPEKNLSKFFLSWIRQPHKTIKTSEQKWENANALLSTAFAQANLERHNVTDKGGAVAKAVKKFLSECEPVLVEKYQFFKKFMLLMPEEIDEKQFEKLLISYLSEFLKLTK